MNHPAWDIHREGRQWTYEEILARLGSIPEKFEIIDGKLLWEEEDRQALLALLLENVGIDATLRLAPIELWREAIAAIPTPPDPQS